MVRAKVLKKCIVALYDYRTHRLAVKGLKEKAREYLIANLQNKTFESLLWYAQKRIYLNELKEKARLSLKRRFINKWITALLKNQALKEKLLLMINTGENLET